MEPKAQNDGVTTIENTPFSVLIKADKDLAGLRRDYASKPSRERRMAADWEYHSQMATELFNDTIAQAYCLEKSYPEKPIYLTLCPICATLFIIDGGAL